MFNDYEISFLFVTCILLPSFIVGVIYVYGLATYLRALTLKSTTYKLVDILFYGQFTIIPIASLLWATLVKPMKTVGLIFVFSISYWLIVFGVLVISLFIVFMESYHIKRNIDKEIWKRGWKKIG